MELVSAAGGLHGRRRKPTMGQDRQQLALDWSRPTAVETPKGLGLSDEERRVLGVLERHRGRDAAISAPQFAAAAGIPERRLRDVLRHLVIAHQVPMGSSPGTPAGYYLIVSDDERIRTRESLFGRALRILQRARAYDRSGYASRLCGQMEIELQEDER